MIRILPSADVVETALNAFTNDMRIVNDRRGNVGLAKGRDLIQYNKAIAIRAYRDCYDRSQAFKRSELA